MEPTRINGRIREFLDSFNSSAYVGYTATPFANIFINPTDVNSLGKYREDLFPRDFLINIPAPSNHIGPTKLFGLYPDSTLDVEPVDPLPLLVTIDDHAEHIPDVHKADLIVDNLPPSLKEGIKAFILVCAAKAARRTVEKHNSMLVHVTRFQNPQGQVAELVSRELRDLQNRIRYGDGASPYPILELLEHMWVHDFEPISEQVRALEPELAANCIRVSWNQVREQLITTSQRTQVKTINGSAQDALDYWDHPDGVSLIAIGGDKLSRGLTLEGLSVSYYLRSSRMYDTLLQIGRWFGYRPGYVDLCRLYTTEELSEFYAHITMAEFGIGSIGWTRGQAERPLPPGEVDLLGGAGINGQSAANAIQFDPVEGDVRGEGRDNFLIEMCKASGRPFQWGAVSYSEQDPERYKEQLAFLERARSEGATMFAQTSDVPVSPVFELAEYNGFDGMPNWIDPFVGTPEERIAKLNTPGVRDSMRKDVGAWSGLGVAADVASNWSKMRVVEVRKDSNLQYEGMNVAELAWQYGAFMKALESIWEISDELFLATGGSHVSQFFRILCWPRGRR